MIRTSVIAGKRPSTRVLSSMLVANNNLLLHQSQRNFQSSSLNYAASLFNMPAMSPTMEQGGIIKWNFKEGDSFSAGESLLEVETDKATIDVEAQDDGILAKIVISEGTKDIPVGKPIAVLAEPGDDLASLEMPKLDEAEAAPKETKAKEQAPPKKAESKPEAKSSPKPSSSSDSSSIFTTANPNQKFFPSVELLLEQNNISREDALSQIKASAPKGRITKGDVLAFLGKISKDSVSSIASFINSKSHLDLSNIQLKQADSKTSSEKGEKTSGDAEKSKKPSKPEPVKVARTFVLPQTVSQQQLQAIVQRASRLAEQYSYMSPLYAASDYVDPIFEDLVAPSHNAERFQIKVKINDPAKSSSSSATIDPFDLLVGATSPSFALAGTQPAALPSVEVEAIVNNKVADAKQRAELYVAKFGELLVIPNTKTTTAPAEEFEF